MDLDRPHFRTTSLGSSSTNTAAAAAATTSELFICFTSRLSSSSSSMKLTKSILSPGRAARDCAPVSLSSSLSRRLRTNGSLKGGQASPFFTTSGKKRGCAFENPEPSSPKVTCIGQVRVKTKKKVKQSRSLSKRRSGEASFRKIEQAAADGGHPSEDNVCTQQKCSNVSEHFQQQQPQECLNPRNQRWVHLPISICEGLRSFGSEFSCLFPCKSSCFSTSEREKSKTEKQNGSSGSENGCGAVFTRWLVSVNDGEGGKRREIELVVGGGDEEIRAERISMRSSRRHVFEDIEVKEDRIEVKGQNVGEEDEAARVSICIPPKNALLLMRCRSDPMKMAALANRFSWDAQAAPKVQDEDIEGESNGGQVGEENEDFEERVESVHGCEAKEEILMVKTPEIDEDSEQDISVEPKEEQENPNEAEGISTMEDGDGINGEENQDGGLLIINIEEMVAKKQEQEESQQESVVMNDNSFLVAEEEVEEEEEEVESNMSSFEAYLDQENAEPYEDYPVELEQKEEVEESLLCHLSSSIESDVENESNEVAAPLHEEAAVENENEKEETGKLQTAETNTIFKESGEENQVEAQPISEPEKTRQDEQKIATQPIESELESKENQELLVRSQEREKEKESPVLPECLLLMMCEPKLSMEVSKETWVCSTDFVKWLPERSLKPAKSAKGGGCDHVPIKRRLSVDFKPKPVTHKDKNDQNLQQPRRSSCSLPPATAAASMATLIEQKLVNAVAYEPLVLTRCKSEPMRTAASKLIPESCFWKNAIRKLEPQRRATLGAAGVGF